MSRLKQMTRKRKVRKGQPHTAKAKRKMKEKI